jgi:hypothetical protein
MKVAFWLLLSLSLTVALSSDVRVHAAPPENKESSASDESVDPSLVFPLAKRNGLVMESVRTESPLGKNVTNVNFVASFAGGRKALEKVVAHPENATGIQLAVAANTLFRAGDLEEAGFLFNACRLRFAYDLDKYQPKKTDSTGTEWFLSLLVDNVKEDVITSLYLHPKAMNVVVKRLESFELKEPAGYDPGWDYTRQDVPADLFARNKAMMLASMKPTSELLLLPEYFAAFREYRDCSVLLTADLMKGGRGLPEVEKRRKTAADTMRRIENDMNLQGPMYQVEQIRPVD